MSLVDVAAAYECRAAEYIERFGDIADISLEDRQFVLDWAATICGPILDVGCGPGQWTELLFANGFQATGIDPVPEFIDHARMRYPGSSFRLGEASKLNESSVGGILAWYSLIHLEPDTVPQVLRSWAQTLRPDGGLAVGFFAGSRCEAFEHSVHTAYFWPPEQLAQLMTDAGFTVTAIETRNDPSARPHGAMTARLQDR